MELLTFRIDRQTQKTLKVGSTSEESATEDGTLEVRIRLLGKLGLTWKSRDRGTWEDHFTEVATFRTRYGHCEIPRSYPESPKLANFVNNMRTQRNAQNFQPSESRNLTPWVSAWKATGRTNVQIGGSSVSTAWKLRFEELLAYKQAHGDCNIQLHVTKTSNLGIGSACNVN